MNILGLFSFLAGMCTVLSLRILPIAPIALPAGSAKDRLRPLGIILGLIISCTFVTLTIASIVQASGLPSEYLRYIAIGLVFLFGLFMAVPALSSWLSKAIASIAKIGDYVNGRKPKEGLIGGLIFGNVLGLILAPFAGPILVAITTLIATQTIVYTSVFLAATYAIGSSIPLFIIACGKNSIFQTSKFLHNHTEGIRSFFGYVIIFVAFAIAFLGDLVLDEGITQVIPSFVTENNQLAQEELDNLQKEMKRSDEDHVQIPNVGMWDSYSLYRKAPELTGLSHWINSQPLLLKNLKGKVVLIDFWTYSCINCLRTLPYLKDLYAKYKDKGFVIIGIHTPEFEFEKDPLNVDQAVSRLGITYPVAQDNAYKVWRAYDNVFWPAHYLIDQNGNIVFVHFGEGGYEDLEKSMQKLLKLSAPLVTNPSTRIRSISPETYLGTNRGRSYTSQNTIEEGQVAHYTYSPPLGNDEIGLRGDWLVGSESITAKGDDSYLDSNFLGKQAYLVLSGTSSTPVEVILDGHHIGKIYLDGDRKYDVATTSYGRHSLLLKIPKGISAYAFTFGDE